MPTLEGFDIIKIYCYSLKPTHLWNIFQSNIVSRDCVLVAWLCSVYIQKWTEIRW